MWLLVISTVIGLLRFTVPGHGLSWPGTYEAFAHIWVGVLIGFGLRGKSIEEGLTVFSEREKAWALLTCLTLLEIVVFLIQKGI